MKKGILRVLVLFIALYMGVLGYVAINQRNLLYHPDKVNQPLQDTHLENTTEIFLTTSDGIKLQTWYHPPLPGKDLVIYFHGNAHGLAFRNTQLKALSELGYGFLICAWRGFGESQGSPSQEGIFTDARTVIEFAKSNGYKTENIILVGESLGSGIATKMATEQQFKGIFLITPYTTISERAQEIYFYLPVSLLLKDNFDNINNIKNVHVPVFIIHGTNDSVIPHNHGERVFEAANEPKKIILYPGLDHVDYDSKLVFTEMENFFKSLNR